MAPLDDGATKPKTRWTDSLRSHFLAGLLVFLPLAITLWFIGWVINLLDSVLAVLGFGLDQGERAICLFLRE